GLTAEVKGILGLDLPVATWAKEEGIADEEIEKRILEAADARAAARAANIGPELMRRIEKHILLQTLDHDWREHIVQLDHLRQIAGLRGYAQRDPLNEFKTEAFSLFEHLLSRLRTEVTRTLMNIEVQLREGPPPPSEPVPLQFGPNGGPGSGGPG